MKHHQKSDWRLDLPIFSYAYQKCIFVDFMLESNVSPLSCVHCSLLSVE